VVVLTVGLWRDPTGDGGWTHLDAVGDVTDDPVATPRRAARHR
jgi:hypothetical protein